MTAWQRILLALLVAGVPFGPAAAAPPASTQVVTADIENFWIAHDAIRSEADPARKQRLIQSLYIDRGTPGLLALMQARGYTAEQYVAAIDAWPRYWASVRPLTHRAFAATTAAVPQQRPEQHP